MVNWLTLIRHFFYSKHFLATSLVHTSTFFMPTVSAFNLTSSHPHRCIGGQYCAKGYFSEQTRGADFRLVDDEEMISCHSCPYMLYYAYLISPSVYSNKTVKSVRGLIGLAVCFFSTRSEFWLLISL